MTFSAPKGSLLPCASPGSLQAAWTRICSPRAESYAKEHGRNNFDQNIFFFSLAIVYCKILLNWHTGWYWFCQNTQLLSCSQWSKMWRSWACSRTSQRSTVHPASRWSWDDIERFKNKILPIHFFLTLVYSWEQPCLGQLWQGLPESQAFFVLLFL